jgi:hypothetical protein
VTIPTAIATLRLSGLRECIIRAGPVSGSVYVEQAHDCLLTVGAHQLRIHDSHRCTFLVAIKGPESIIENCDELRFGPYRSWLPPDAELSSFPAAGFDATTAPPLCGRWQHVRDFNVLPLATSSAHWRVLSPAEQADLAEQLNFPQSLPAPLKDGLTTRPNQ